MTNVTVDDKGRITIPEDLREKLGIRRGSKVRIRLHDNDVVLASVIDPKEFVKKMEGFVKEGSSVEKMDPLRLKEIWIS